MNQGGTYTAVCKYEGGECPKDFTLAQNRQCPVGATLNYDKPNNKLNRYCPEATSPAATFINAVLTPGGTQNTPQGFINPTTEGNYTLGCEYDFNGSLKSCP